MFMKYNFELLKVTRTNMLNSVKGLSFESLTNIPKGFNNNIQWNFCHTILVQHLLCYKLSGIPFDIEPEVINRYSKGTKANPNMLKSDFEFFKTIALTSVEALERRYNKNVFKVFNPYSTSYNITLNSIEEAITFNNVHEGLHVGYILALKKAL